MNHISLQPYKSSAVNKLDTIVLLIMLLLISLNNFNFSKSATVGLILTLVLLPLLLSLMFGLILKFHNFNQTYNRCTVHR